MSPADVCAYCATATLAGDEKPEHAIPAALGATLMVRTVCEPCNEWAGREVDQPFLSDQLMREYRSLADQRDPRRGKKARRVTSQVLQGLTVEGDRVFYDYETGRPVMGSRIVDLGDGRYQIRAGSEEEAERLRERLRQRVAGEGKELKVEKEERGESRPRIEAKMMIRTDVWSREAAKIALAVSSAVYPPEWRSCPDAHRLREWMNNRDPGTSNGMAPPLVPRQLEALARFVQREEHLVFFTRLVDGYTYILVILFGTVFFAQPVDMTGEAAPTQAWRLDWHDPPTCKPTTWDEIVTDAVARSIGSQDDLSDGGSAAT